MGGPITFPQLLLLSAFGIVFLSSVASATDNTTQGLLTPANSSTSQESCPGAALLDSSRSIFAAVDSLVGELSCKRKENGSQSEDPFMEVEQNIQRIVESSIKVFSDLGTNLSGSDVLEQIGILDSLSVDNYNDPAFIRLWFSLKMTFLLPFVTDSFLFQLGNKNFSCSSFQELVKSLSERLETSQTTEREQIYSNFIRVYLTRKEKAEAGCTENVEGSEDWLDKNIQSFLVFATLQDLKTMNRNFSGSDVLEKLSPQQRAELILDPDSGALEDADFVRLIIKNVTMSGDDEQLNHFFQKFSILSKETNTTYIQNVAVRETIFNLTLSSLALKFDVFEVQDYQLWFQVYLIPVIASIQPDSLQVIPRNISCESYGAIVTGLMESLKILPLDVSMDVRSSLESLQEAFPDCATLDSFTCKDTHVDEKLICSEVDSSRLQALENDNSPGAVCNFTVTEHACAPTRRLSAENLAKLLKCSLESNQMYVVEVWQLLFQKASPVLSQALASFSDMAPTAMSAAYSNPLDALREVVAKNLTQDQLKSEDFVKSWFQARLGPFLASPSTNFLFCLGTYNFSCQTYQIVIGAFSNQSPLMDVDRKRAVFTHFIQPFLSRKDLPDPGCVSSANSSQLWLQANLGNFSQFASVGDLQALYPNFSSAEALSKLSPSQVAELLLSTDISNDTQFVDKVFERLEVGNAVENVDAFFTKLTEKGEVPEFQVDVRDRIMNKTYIIIGPFFPEFPEKDLFDWFHVKLVPVLPSFTPQMLQGVITNINCTKYQVIVSGMGKVVSAVGQDRQKEIAAVLLQYLKNSADVINQPACRENIQTDSQWVETNLGPFSPYATYSELKFFNLSQEALVSVLSPAQKAELLTDPGSNALEDATLVKEVLTNLTESGNVEQLGQFFLVFTQSLQQTNTTYIQNVAVRETIFNLTLSSLALKFDVFEVQDYQLWFQVYLIPVIASIQPDSLQVIPRNISCESYGAIVTGLMESLKILPLDVSMDVRSSLESLQEAFPDCATLDSFTCKDTHVDEKLICSEVDSSRLQALENDNSPGAVCNFTVTEHACAPTRRLSAENLAKLLKCSLESNQMYVVEVWQLLFQKASPVLSQALASFSDMAPTAMSAAYSNPLDALREVVAKNLTQDQLKSEDFVKSWFQARLGPFLASPSTNFLFCLGTYNFSCQTYQIVIGAFSNQSPLMDVDRKRAVFTHFIQPFLSRKDLPDPGCVSSANSSQLWLQANLGNFSQFASVGDLQALYPNFSSAEALSKLSPSQVAELLLSTDISNDTQFVDKVFERLEVGNAVENVDAFFTKLTEKGEVPEFQVDVRDRIMNKTYIIIGPFFPEFPEKDLFDWFHVKLVPVLPSFTPQMLQGVITNINCTKYQVIVSGMGKVVSAVGQDRQKEIAAVLLQYLKNSADVINQPACRENIQTDSQWVETNLGPFSPYATYSELKFFNLSQSAILDSLSPGQKAEFLLQPDILANVSLVVTVFERFTASASLENLESFFNTFVDGLAKQNLTAVNASMRENILNLTITALAPKFYLLNLEGFRLWFQIYLPLFLPSVKSTTFEIIPRNISCSSYQQVIKGLDNIISQLSKAQNQEVLKFGLDYLKAQLTSGLSCVDAGTEINDRSWLEDNFGQFRLQASFKDFLSLKKDFKGAEVADLLTLSQLKELAATPSQLNGTQDVTKVMTVIEPADFAAFFDSLSQAVVAKSVNYSLEVKSAFLQEVFNRGGLPAVSDEDFLQWLRRLQPLLTDLSPNLVPRLFSLAANRSCATSHETINVLDTIQTTLSNNTKTEVYRNILIFLQDSTPLKCYSGGSFYLFLQNFFLSFGFPDVATFISLLPPKRESELLNTISTSELSQFLNQPDVVSNNTDICIIFSNYNNTPSFLENEDVPDDVRRIILPCVWPLALSSNRRSEVDLWFNVRLRNYLRFLTKDLISFNKVQNSSCLAFQKLVSFMGKNFTYTGSDFGQPDVYAVIRSYLGAESAARCYNPTDPDLNSTSWFVNYISTFVIFITLDDFKGFVNISQVNVFLEDKANLELFNNAAIPQDVTDYYILQLYEFYPSFGLIMLPGSLLCSPDIPSSLFASLNEADTMAILDKLKRFCNSTENPERSAALASNIKVITAQTFADLGSASSGLTNSQILSVPPEVLVSSLSILGSVNTWGQDQASNIIHSIISSGFQINSSASLASLGTLIIGVPSKSINSISASEALRASKNPMLVSNMLEAPKVVQEIFVKKIISVDSSPAKVVQNVPDALATEIPPSLLVFSEGTANITVINKKTWTADQSTMFFPTLAEADFDTEQLSPFVLQGFTCGTVKKMTKPKISQLIHACRPRKGRAKVELKEPQLTCMYNLIRGDLSQNFTDYPSDMLLYLDSENVQKANCRSYFSALGATDFSVASSILNKGPKKFREARDCLGISGVSLSRDNVEVLGNMVCTLDRSDIENSDPLILEKLKACKDLSASQVAAMETLLLSGKTQYGAVNSWDQQTLQGLGTLPLYLTRNIWTHFTATTTKRFLKGFMPELRKQKTEKKKLKTLFSELAPTVAKRGAGCSEGNITQVTVSDPSFPFGYNQLQFELCLDVPILKDNLHSICQKVDDDGYQRIILNKLNQAFPSGVPDQDVQMLASVSRSATLDDISKWNITELDTLAALMKPEDGTWKTAQSKAIITKYLKASGNSLDSSELNIIDSNLCSLDTSTLQTITADSMRNTKHLDVASCSTEQKRVLYEISNTSFSVHRDNPINYYNLVKGYLGGAPRADIAALSRQNISMDVDTFRSLDINVITNLTVANVQGLMGENLRDLKLFENDTVVQIWVNLQLQSDLDTLGLGLITTRADPTVPTATNSTEPQGNTNGSNTTPATTAIPSQSATTSGVLEFTKSPASVLLTALLTAALQIILQPA